MSQQRILFLGALLLIPLLAIEARLFRLQVVEGPAAQELLAHQSLQIELSSPARGRLRTRDGVVLAQDERCFDLLVIPDDLQFPDEWIDAEAETLHVRSSRLLQWCRDEDEGLPAGGLSFAKRTGLSGTVLTGIVTRLRDLRRETFERLARELAVPVAEVAESWKKILDRCARRGAGRSAAEGRKIAWNEGAFPQVFRRGIPFDVARRIEVREEEFSGFRIEEGMKRAYPAGSLAGTLTGYVARLNDAEIEEEREAGTLAAEVGTVLGEPEAASLLRPEAFSEDRTGRTGLERAWEDRLHGQWGALLIERLKGRRQPRVVRRIAPAPGADITLTLDAAMQARGEQAYRAEGAAGRAATGAALVMDLSDGSVLACISMPGYDPNVFIPPAESGAISTLLQSKLHPLINRTVSEHYPLGSVFKIVTGLAALETGQANAGTGYTCDGSLTIGGREKHCMHVHGPLVFGEALTRSCNIYFYHLGMSVGGERLGEYASRLGFGRPTGIDCPFEIPGTAPTAEWKRSEGLSMRWSDQEAANMAIGQPPVQVTPVQALRLIAAVATSGRLIRPKLDAAAPAESVSVEGVSAESWKKIQEALRNVVHGEGGTASHSPLAALDVAGKTGTAQVQGRADHAWFAGYGPVAAPRYAFVVLVEHGGTGGDAPPRIATAMLKGILPEWKQ